MTENRNVECATNMYADKDTKAEDLREVFGENTADVE